MTTDITETIPRAAYADGHRVAVYVALAYPSPSVPRRLEEALVIGRQPGRWGLTLVDSGSSRSHARLKPSGGPRDAPLVEDLGSKNGTFVDGRRVQVAPLDANATLRMGNSLLVVSTVDVGPGGQCPRPTLGESPRTADVRAAVDRVAAADLPVLIRGPTGAGKERVAQALHARSGRSGRLVSVNCAALSAELLVSELFGHVRGAFSGANAARTGLFVAARGGTLFLDEIAEMPLDQQPALLRALQERRVRPVGADHEVDVDVRIVAATHQDLAARVQDGRFRADLYARLAGVELLVPPLRARREDPPPLRGVPRHRRRVLRRRRRSAARVRLAVQRARVDQCGPGAASRACRPSPRRAEPAPEDRAAYTAVARASADDQEGERSMLIDLLREHDGNISAVARATDQSRQQLYRRFTALGINPTDYRDPSS